LDRYAYAAYVILCAIALTVLLFYVSESVPFDHGLNWPQPLTAAGA